MEYNLTQAEFEFKMRFRPRGHCYVNHEKKQMFVSIPKTGSTSSNELLRKHGFIIADYLTHPELHSYYTAVVLRDPYQRFLSLSKKYRYIFRSDDLSTRREMMINLLTSIQVSGKKLDMHYCKAVILLSDKNRDIIPVNKYIKLENIHELPCAFGIEEPIKHLNQNIKFKKIAIQFFDENKDLKEMVVDTYKEDKILYNSVFGGSF